MGDMREAFNDLNGAANLDQKASSLSDYDLASAILLALPQSFSTLVSALMLRDTLTSSEVVSLVSDDYRRRAAAESQAALLASRYPAPVSVAPKALTEPRGQTAVKKCANHPLATTHTTAECRIRKPRGPAPLSTPSANVAEAQPLAEDDPSSHLVKIAPLSALFTTTRSSSIVVDSGCSTTMVMDKTLLHDVVSLTNPVQIAVGNKEYVYAKKKGMSQTRRLIGLTARSSMLHTRI
jgi:hypothetical protein